MTSANFLVWKKETIFYYFSWQHDGFFFILPSSPSCRYPHLFDPPLSLWERLFLTHMRSLWARPLNLIMQTVTGSQATHVTRRPAVWIPRNCFQFWTIDIVIPSRDSNLGPKRLSLLEFETWRLGPVAHHCRFVMAFISSNKFGFENSLIGDKNSNYYR